jgi:4-hydroxybenzoate polyprenyltransferase
MTQFTDMRATGWVSRAPASWQPYLLLARLDRPIGVWLLYLPGVWGILLARSPWPATIWLLLLFAIGSVVMRAAGCVVNDMWDRDLDRRVARTAGRPLASGALGLRQAVFLLVALLLAGLAVLLQLNRTCWALGVGILVLVALYPLAKRVTWWPQLVMGFTFAFGAPMGYVAASGQIDVLCAALYAAAILWDLGFDTIYGFQDIEDDTLIGVKSTSRRFAHAPKAFVGSAYALCTLALMSVAWLADFSLIAWLALLSASLWLFQQVAYLDAGDPALCLRLFRSNRQAGLAIAASLLVGRL